jgi:hypothetical protein
MQHLFLYLLYLEPYLPVQLLLLSSRDVLLLHLDAHVYALHLLISTRLKLLLVTGFHKK